MCVIIDASIASHVFAVPCEADFQPLWDWIEIKDGKVVYGGELHKELKRLEKTRRRLIQLWRAGKALQMPDKEVCQKERAVVASGQCRSDDPHVIALARVSGARVLCTNDRNLEKDFGNLDIVPRPKGKIYKNADHKHLLQHNRICVGRPKRR